MKRSKPLLDWVLRPKHRQYLRPRSVLLLMLLAALCYRLLTTVLHTPAVHLNYGLDCELVQAYLQGRTDSLPPEVADVFVSVELLEVTNGLRHTIMHRPFLNCLEADSGYLIEKLQKDYLVPPVPHLAPPKHVHIEGFDAHHQSLDIFEMIFKNQEVKNGFFLEAGAADCEGLVSQPFVNQLNWTGLLVEAVPLFFQLCLNSSLRSAVTLLNSCVGTNTMPHFINFDTMSAAGEKSGNHIMPGFAGKNASSMATRLQCFPLYSMLLAMGNPTVNLLVLDIEGFELAVLRTIPWDKVNIEVLSVETEWAGVLMDGSREEIIHLLSEAGYARFNHRNDFNSHTGKNSNDLFVRRDIVTKYNVVQL